jgi:hypothetical protein
MEFPKTRMQEKILMITLIMTIAIVLYHLLLMIENCNCRQMKICILKEINKDNNKSKYFKNKHYNNNKIVKKENLRILQENFHLLLNIQVLIVKDSCSKLITIG